MADAAGPPEDEQEQAQAAVGPSEDEVAALAEAAAQEALAKKAERKKRGKAPRDEDAMSVASYKLALAAYRPGTNTLRGVVKSFSQRTLQSNWVEDRFNPSTTTANQTLRDRVPDGFDTTTGSQMRGSASGFASFGGGNPKGPRNVVNPETVHIPWESVTKSTFKQPDSAARTEFATNFKPRKPPTDLVQSYSKWAKESGRTEGGFNRFVQGTEYKTSYKPRA